MADKEPGPSALKITFDLREVGDPIATFQPGTDSEHYRRAFELVGRAVMLWSQIEGDLAYLVYWLHPPLEHLLPQKLRGKPAGLTRMLKVMSYMTKNFSEMERFAHNFEAFKKNIQHLEGHRHRLVHWPVLGHEIINEELVIKFYNAETMGTKLEQYRASESELLKLNGELGRLRLFFGMFSTSMADGIRRDLAKAKKDATPPQ